MNFFSVENVKFSIPKNMIDSSTLLSSLSLYEHTEIILNIKSEYLDLMVAFNKKFPKSALLPICTEKNANFKLPIFNNFKDMNLSVVHTTFKDSELDFFNEYSLNFLYELSNAANYIGYLYFLEVICKKIAIELNSKDTEKALKFFNIPNDEIEKSDLQWLP